MYGKKTTSSFSTEQVRLLRLGWFMYVPRAVLGGLHGYVSRCPDGYSFSVPLDVAGIPSDLYA